MINRTKKGVYKEVLLGHHYQVQLILGSLVKVRRGGKQITNSIFKILCTCLMTFKQTKLSIELQKGRPLNIFGMEF